MSEERTLQEQCYGTCWAACERIDELEQERASLRAEVERLKAELGPLRELVGVDARAASAVSDITHWTWMMDKADKADSLTARVGELERHLNNVLRIVDRFSEEICKHEAERYESAVAAMKEAE